MQRCIQGHAQKQTVCSDIYYSVTGVIYKGFLKHTASTVPCVSVFSKCRAHCHHPAFFIFHHISSNFEFFLKCGGPSGGETAFSCHHQDNENKWFHSQLCLFFSAHSPYLDSTVAAVSRGEKTMKVSWQSKWLWYKHIIRMVSCSYHWPGRNETNHV